MVPQNSYAQRSINIGKQNCVLCFRRGVLNTPDPDYLGLMIGIWDSLGLDFATFLIFYFVSSLIMGKYCLFSQPMSGVEKMRQYAPVFLLVLLVR